MANNQFINLEELSKTTQALLSKINEQSNLKVNKANVNAEYSEGTKIADIENVEIYAPEIDTSDFVTYNNLAQVAYTGIYNDLDNKPSLATVATSGNYNDLSNRPSLAKVATSGLYVDIQNLPKIPFVDINTSGHQIVSSYFYPTSNYPTFFLHNSDPISFSSGSITISPQDTSNKQLLIHIYDASGKSQSNGTIPKGYHYVTDYTVQQNQQYNSATMYLNTQAYNSITVSGHTVATNVPANAKFTDTVYDDTAISSRISTLENAGYQNSAQVNSAIATAIGNINSFDVSIVPNLPTTNISTHTIYFKSNSSSGNNIYDEYMYINNNWELIGSTQIDLTPYALSANLATVATSGDYDDLTDAPIAETDANVEDMLDSFDLDYTSNTSSPNYAAGVNF